MAILNLKSQNLAEAKLPVSAVFKLSDRKGGYIEVRANSLKEARKLRDKVLTDRD